MLTPRRCSPIEQTVRALDALRKEGKTKYIGLSEVGLSRASQILRFETTRLTLLSGRQCSAETLRRAAKEAKIDFVEVEYSPWELVMERNGVLDTCKELGIKVLAYSPLGRGFLTG